MKVSYVPIVDEWFWHEPKGVDYLAKTVYEPEPRPPVKTGILDASGAPLYRVEKRDPIGFVRPKC